MPSINIATRGKFVYRRVIEPTIRTIDRGGGSAFVEEKIPFVSISRVQEIKKKKKIIKVTLLDEV